MGNSHNRKNKKRLDARIKAFEAQKPGKHKTHKPGSLKK